MSANDASTDDDCTTTIPYLPYSDAATSLGGSGNGSTKEDLVSEFHRLPS